MKNLSLLIFAMFFGVTAANAQPIGTADNLNYIILLSDKISDADRTELAGKIEAIGKEHGNGYYDYLGIFETIVVNLTSHGLKLVEKLPGIEAIEVEGQAHALPRTGRSNASGGFSLMSVGTTDNVNYLISMNLKLTKADRDAAAARIEAITKQQGDGTFTYLKRFGVVIANLTSNGAQLVNQMPEIIEVKVEGEVHALPRTGRSNASATDCNIQLRPSGDDVE